MGTVESISKEWPSQCSWTVTKQGGTRALQSCLLNFPETEESRFVHESPISTTN